MEHIEYARTVVPWSMRSPYWKYFGFPSDNSNNILTRQKIVCTICNTAIAYNKNTSNLRTHLMSKHVEIFQKIIELSYPVLDPEQNKLYQNRGINQSNIDNKKRCIEISKDKVSTAMQNKMVKSVEQILAIPALESSSSILLANKIDLKSQYTDNEVYLESQNAYLVTGPRNAVSNVVNMEDNPAYTESDHHEEHEQEMQALDIMLADFMQTDLLPLHTLEEHGFCKYNQQLTGLKLDSNTVHRVTKIIEKRLVNMNQMVDTHVHLLSQFQPYSLSFEIYKDDEEHEILNIYFNYLDEQMDLISIFYTSSLICSKTVNMSEILSNINLKNCSGLVVSSLDNMFQFVLDFAKSYDLPLIECLESMLTRCLQKILEQTEFCAAYEHFVQLFSKKQIQIHGRKQLNFKPQCQWSKLKFLEHIFQSMEERNTEKWSELRQCIEYLKPLKMTMDIITSEPLPLCSLIRPLIKKLFEEHFRCIDQIESGVLYKTQQILKQQLYERIIGKHIFNEITFFDLRFRGYAVQEPFFDVTKLKSEVIKRFKHIIQVTCVHKESSMKEEPNSAECVDIRKCSLKTFFDRNIAFTNSVVTTDVKTNLDFEIEQYQNQVCLDLEQSPALWWQQQSGTYTQLSKIARYYLSIPCCVLPRLCTIDLEQRYSKLKQRKNLSQFCRIESKLWYLHYNESVVELL